jgi:hypothetical protein
MSSTLPTGAPAATIASAPAIRSWRWRLAFAPILLPLACLGISLVVERDRRRARPATGATSGQSGRAGDFQIVSG